MAKPRATGADARLIGITEVTYGTAPTNGYFLLPFKSTDLDKETPLGDDPLLGQGRAAQGAYYDRPQVSGGIEIPLDIQSAGFWLHGLMGAPSSSTVKAYGSFTFSAQPANSSTITLNGVTWTFVTGAPTGNQTQIGVDLDATLTALATNLNASVDAEIAKVTYTADTANDQLDMEFDTAGTTGNAWTLASSATSNASRSAAKLIGGGSSHLFTAGGTTPSKVLEVGHTQLATPSYRRFLGVNVNDFAFTLSPRGVASARINAVAQQRVIATSSIDSSTTDYTVTRFSQGNGMIKVGGTQIASITGGDFSFTNSPDVVETIRADGLIDGVDMGQARASGSMTVRLSDSATQATLQNAFEAQSPVVLQYGFEHPLGWQLLFDMPRVLLSAPKAPITGPGGIEQQIAWQAENDTSAGYGLRVTLLNDIAAYA